MRKPAPGARAGWGERGKGGRGGASLLVGLRDGLLERVHGGLLRRLLGRLAGRLLGWVLGCLRGLLLGWLHLAADVRLELEGLGLVVEFHAGCVDYPTG